MNTKQRYREKLRDPRWQKARLEILNRDGWACTNCGNAEEELQVHHEEYNGDPWETPSEKLKTLCRTCHERISKSPYQQEFVTPYARLLWCAVSFPKSIPWVQSIFTAMNVEDETFKKLSKIYSPSITTALILEKFRNEPVGKNMAQAAISEIEYSATSIEVFVLRAVADLIEELDTRPATDE